MAYQPFDFAARATSRALGEPVTWRPGTPSEEEIEAVVGDGFSQVASAGVREIRVGSRRLEITVALSDLPEPVQEGYEVVVRGETCEIARPEQDIEGVSVKLILKRT